MIARVSTPFLLIAQQNSIVRIYHTLFIHSLIDGQFSDFHLLAIMTNVGMTFDGFFFVFFLPWGAI